MFLDDGRHSKEVLVFIRVLIIFLIIPAIVIIDLLVVNHRSLVLTTITTRLNSGIADCLRSIHIDTLHIGELVNHGLRRYDRQDFTFIVEDGNEVSDLCHTNLESGLHRLPTLLDGGCDSILEETLIHLLKVFISTH